MALKGEKVVTVNLNQILRDGIHKIRTKSGFPLYTHTEAYDKNQQANKEINADYMSDELNSGIYKSALRDPDYIKFSRNTYSSPTNIRYIFITGAKIYVTFYDNVVKNGVQNNSTPRSTEYSIRLKACDNKNLFEVAKDIAEYPMQQQKYSAELAMGHKPSPLNCYTFNSNQGGNNLFKALSLDYTLNNLEGIYFDWTVLLSEEILPLLNLPFRSSYDVACSFLGRSGSMSGISIDDGLITLINKYNLGQSRDINTKFPRLREVAIIENLKGLINSAEAHSPTPALGALTAETVHKSFLDLNVNFLKQQGGLVRYAKLQKASLTEFVVKDYIYEYDKVYLKAYFESYKQKIQQIIRKQSYNVNEIDTRTGIYGGSNKVEDGAKVDSSQYSDFEREMDAAEQKIIEFGRQNNESAEKVKARINRFFKAAMVNFNKSEKELLLTGVSSQHSERYRKLAGLNSTK